MCLECLCRFFSTPCFLLSVSLSLMIPLKSPPQNPLSVLPSQHFTQRRHVGLSPLSGSSCWIFFPLLTVHLSGHSSTSAASFCFLSADLPLGDHLWMQTKNVAQAKVTHFSSRTFFFSVDISTGFRPESLFWQVGARSVKRVACEKRRA